MLRNVFSNGIPTWNDQSFPICLQYQICDMSIECDEEYILWTVTVYSMVTLHDAIELGRHLFG